MITEPGIYTLRPEEYHADPCPAPSLSSSIGRVLIERSPRHAWFRHPRLNPGRPEDSATKGMDEGSALHKLILGEGADIVGIQAEDWRSKAAKDARDEARSAGRIPILSARLRELRTAADAITEQMRAIPDCAPFFESGHSEAALIWREGQSWCRALADRLPDRPDAPMFDLKTTDLSAAPESWDRRLVSEYAFQAAFYMIGAHRLGRRPRAFVFVVAERDPPYGVSLLAPDPSLMAAAEEDVQRALRIWERCMKTGEWPGYQPFIAYVSAPPWLTNKQAERALRDETIEETV